MIMNMKLKHYIAAVGLAATFVACKTVLEQTVPYLATGTRKRLVRQQIPLSAPGNRKPVGIRRCV